MKNKGKAVFSLIFFIMFLAAACSQDPGQPEEIGRFPVDDLEGIITRSGVQIDREITSDGNGSLQVTANEPVIVKLYETGDIHLENKRLIYRARLRTEDVEGQVYLEMWCSFPGKGEFFSRALQAPLSGSNEWSTQETPFILQKGENPDNVKMNLVINGKGKVWIDDIRLVMAPLQQEDAGPAAARHKPLPPPLRRSPPVQADASLHLHAPSRTSLTPADPLLPDHLILGSVK